MDRWIDGSNGAVKTKDGNTLLEVFSTKGKVTLEIGSNVLYK